MNAGLCLVVVAVVGALVAGCAGRRPPPPERSLTLAVTPARIAPVIYEKISATAEPIATRRDSVVEVLHGKRVADPYRWLEDGKSPEVRNWTEAQNRLTERTLGSIPERARLKHRLEELLEIGQISTPTVRRSGPARFRYFYTRRDGKQNQPVLLVRDALNEPDRVLLDPNRLNAEGTTALDWFSPSKDGRLVAYGLSQDGSEESTLRIRTVSDPSDLADVIPRTRAASVCWMPDGHRFFYSRYPKAGSVPPGEEAYHRHIFEHVLGTDPERDRPIFGEGRAMTDYPSCALSPDGRWLVIHVHEGWNKNELFLADTSAKELGFTPLTAGKAHLYDAIVRDDALYILTNEGAPRYALYRVDPRRPERGAWRLLIGEHPSDVLGSVEVVSSNLLLAYLHDGSTRLERFDAQGRSRGAVALPTLGTSDGFSGIYDGHEAFFNFESFAVPPSIQRLDLATGQVSQWQKIDSSVRSADYTVTARKARSKDGTPIPYAMVHRRDADLTSGKAPTLLYGYGGFNVSLEPRFSRTNYAVLERGAIYVQANLRGGGEFGETWHRAGQLEKKQNVFDDFIAVAQDLVQSRVTSPNRLAIFGRSNGGLLVAAAITQRPELFAAAVSSVPLTDMLRYDRFLLGKLWTSEYGSAEDRRQFEYLFDYSPYHHVRAETPYPAVLFTTASSDTRVDPLHARKMTAALQHATSSDRPILLRTETEAGHGAGKPMRKVADEFADIYTFALWQLGVLPSTSASE